MGDVGDALAEYARVVDDAGFDYFGRMEPGRDRDALGAALDAAGLEPHEDAVDWYSFHDGVRPLTGSRYVELFDDVHPCSLDDGLNHRNIRLAGYLAHLGLDDEEIDEIRSAGVEMPFEATWLPISTGQQTCVIDTGATDDHPPLLALWDDEHEPRIKAESLAAWIDDLTGVASRGGLVWRERVKAAGVDRAMFDYGSLTMLDRFVPTKYLIERLQKYRSPGIILRHPPVGSIAGNDNLERRQAEVVAAHLRDVLEIDLPIDYRDGPAEAGRVITIRILAVYPDE